MPMPTLGGGWSLLAAPCTARTNNNFKMLVSAGNEDGFGSATHTPAGACRVPGMHQGSAPSAPDAPAQSQASTSANIPRRRWRESVAGAGIALPPPPGPPPGMPPGPPPGAPPGPPPGAPPGVPGA
eukprot:scaffold50694_cov62-Phaeocystis_antarctica.AAC.1